MACCCYVRSVVVRGVEGVYSTKVWTVGMDHHDEALTLEGASLQGGQFDS